MQTEITDILHRISAGNRSELNDLLVMVYDELRMLAHNQLRKERNNHTLNTTALVHEAYLKLAGQNKHDWKSRAYFFGAASTAMRRILVDYARSKNRDKRKGDHVSLTLADAVQTSAFSSLDDLLALNQAMEKLSTLNERYTQVVECRFFGGLSIEEIAEVLSVSHMTVSRDWRFARAWLHKELAC